MRFRHLVWIPFLYAAEASAEVTPMSLEGTVFAGGFEGDAVLDHAATVGARVMFSPISLVGAELSYNAVFTSHTKRSGDFQTEKTTEDKVLHNLSLGGVLNLADTMVTPYLAMGVGMVILDDVDFAWHAGMGARYFLNDYIGFRAEIRGVFAPDAPAEDNFAHFEGTLGVVGRYGFVKPAYVPDATATETTEEKHTPKIVIRDKPKTEKSDEAAEAPKTNKPKTEVKAEEPKTEEAAPAEEPKAEEAAPAEESKAEEAAPVEEPKAEEPATTDAPAADVQP